LLWTRTVWIFEEHCVVGICKTVLGTVI